MNRELDLRQLNERGIGPETIEAQLTLFRKGIPPVRLSRPASPGDGVILLAREEAIEYAALFRKVAPARDLFKFVPASGVASRMFMEPVLWYNELKGGATFSELINKNEAARQFYEEFKNFAFWDDLTQALDMAGLNVNQLYGKGDFLTLLDYLLNDIGLGYSSKPKGLIPFHKYVEYCRTALEEHLIEGAYYARDASGMVKIHFTVSPEHLADFENLIKKKAPYYENEFGVKYRVTFSLQKPSTDTVAVDLNNELYREADGRLLFRPGGHGALIANLNDLDCDLVFIKNIDNVVPDHKKQETYLYKKALGGLLLKVQQEVFEWLNIIENCPFDDDTCSKVYDFALKNLNLDPDGIKGNLEECRKSLFNFLNRPIRVCGMVKNLGEPGGGPFWVKDPVSGQNTLQIIEAAQINMQEPAQKAIFSVSTHFNPVDLVCSLKDFRGRKFNLMSYIDTQTGFISQKTKNGETIKALELPGLWNGAMASWITLFVEVPLITFNPVKTVSDLLRPEHR
ncbi:MAG TPA: DUF4301 family protein [Bacteroidales bacterium]|nr:DUF4301 family protein [Bacteroidales bacterium]